MPIRSQNKSKIIKIKEQRKTGWQEDLFILILIEPKRAMRITFVFFLYSSNTFLQSF